MKNFLPPCILYVSDPQTRADYCNFYHRTALLSTVFTYIQRPRTLFLHISGLYAQRGHFFTDAYANGVHLSIAAGAACSRTKQMGGFPRKGNILKTKDFDFALPPELIAQTPLEKRDASRPVYCPPGCWAAASTPVGSVAGPARYRCSSTVGTTSGNAWCVRGRSCGQGQRCASAPRES